MQRRDAILGLALVGGAGAVFALAIFALGALVGLAFPVDIRLQGAVPDYDESKAEYEKALAELGKAEDEYDAARDAYYSDSDAVYAAEDDLFTLAKTDDGYAAAKSIYDKAVREESGAQSAFYKAESKHNRVRDDYCQAEYAYSQAELDRKRMMVNVKIMCDYSEYDFDRWQWQFPWPHRLSAARRVILGF